MAEIDDGARSLDEAVEMARIAAADGIEQMVSTPHVQRSLEQPRALRNSRARRGPSGSHRPFRRPPILSKGRDAAAALIGADSARKLVYDNLLAAVNGKALQLEPPVPFESAAKQKRSFCSRFFWPRLIYLI